jgi:hypothetical protein
MRVLYFLNVRALAVLEECQLDRALREQGAEEKVSESRNKEVGWIKSRNNYFRHPCSP